MNISPYLNFNGDCRQAMETYSRVLGLKIAMMQTHRDSPMNDHTPENQKDQILHARLEKDDIVIMASDAPPQHYSKPAGNYLSINVKDVAEAERIYKELSEGGAIHMEMQKTFWAERFGMFADRFGTLWMVNCDQ
jgi:PhnB protein